MKKIILSTIFLVSLFVLGNNAQAQIALGANVGVAVPLGTFGDACTLGFGGGVSGHYFVSPNLSIGANISYTSFGYKDVGGVKFDGSFNILGFAPTINYYFTEEGFRPYVGTDLGYYNLSQSFGSGSISKGYIGLAPTVGFLYGFSDNLSLNVNLKYGIVLSDPNSLSYLPVNVGILYTISK